MKILLLFFCLISISNIYCQGQSIAPPSEGKAAVYFVRPLALGFAINFTYFDSTNLIAKFNGQKYTRYECNPGAHLFWARSENKDFVEAELEAGKIYFLEAIPHMGALKTSVELKPLDLNDSKKMKKALDLIKKQPPESLSSEDIAKETGKMQDVITRGLEKYTQDKMKGSTFVRLDKSKFYTE